MEKSFTPQIVLFACHNTKAAQDPSQNIKLIELPCTGKVEPIYLLKAFEAEADGVAVVGCPEGKCRFLEGNLRAQRRVEHTRKLLDEIGLGGERLSMYLVPQGKLNEVIARIMDKIRELGPSPLKREKH